MNPFNVSKFKDVYLNFSALDMLPDEKQNFVNKVFEQVSSKFSGVNVNIVTQRPSTTNYKEVFIHNNDLFDKMMWGKEKGVIGESKFNLSVAEVNVNEMISDGMVGPDKLAEATGSIASHEAGHLLLPFGHSDKGVNLMNAGDPEMWKAMDSDGGAHYVFTETQKGLMNSGVETPAIIEGVAYDNFTLNDWERPSEYTGDTIRNFPSSENFPDANIGAEGLPFEGISAEASQSMEGVEFEALSDLEVAEAGLAGLDGTEIWGDFDPENITAFAGLGAVQMDVEGFDAAVDLEAFSEVDAEFLSEISDGFFDSIGDLFEGLVEIVLG